MFCQCKIIISPKSIPSILTRAGGKLLFYCDNFSQVHLIQIRFFIFFFPSGDMFGCVVVGVGMAGRVRIRDLLTPLPSSTAEIFTLKGLVSRSVSFEMRYNLLQNPSKISFESSRRIKLALTAFSDV